MKKLLFAALAAGAVTVQLAHLANDVDAPRIVYAGVAACAFAVGVGVGVGVGATVNCHVAVPGSPRLTELPHWSDPVAPIGTRRAVEPVASSDCATGRATPFRSTTNRKFPAFATPDADPAQHARVA